MNDNILEKIKKIEALISGAATEGERIAAIEAKKRVEGRKGGAEKLYEIKEFTCYTTDAWHKKLLIALCKIYGIDPYRYNRQKRTTVMMRVNEELLNNVLWPKYLEYSELLEKIIEDITNDFIYKLSEDLDETIVKGELKA